VTRLLLRAALLSAMVAAPLAGQRLRYRVNPVDSLIGIGRIEQATALAQRAVAATEPGYLTADAALAELSLRRGDWSDASFRATAIAVAFTAGGTGWSAPDIIAAGRAYVVLGSRDPQAFHDALQAFDRATARDSSNIESQVRAADLLLDKYNFADAEESYRAILTVAPNEPHALLGLARDAAFNFDPNATDAARKALAADPAHAPAYVLLAQVHLDAEAYDSAITAASHAIALDSAAVDAWAVLGTIAWLRGDSSGWHAAQAAAARAEPRGATFYTDVADAVAKVRRYREAIGMALQAVRIDSMSARALGVLADNQLRIGAMVDGRANLERSFAIDPYNLWHKNTLDLLDNLRSFKTVTTGRFQFVAPADEADYLALYLGPLLDSAYNIFAARYQYTPPTPIRLEFYNRHADFSVRTIGLPGVGALGASFGTVLVLDSPRSQDAGELNYGSTSLHELAHTFTLGVSGNRMPRWFSEGLSVLEERRTGRGWGARVSPDFIAAYKGKALPSATAINEGLVRPTFPAEIGLSYFEASLVCEMIESEHGIAAIRAMLKGWGDGLDTPAVLQQALEMTPAQFDAHFDQWVRARYAGAFASIDSSNGMTPPAGKYVTLVKEARALLDAGSKDSARAMFVAALKLFPEESGTESPAWYLGHYDRDAGDLQGAITEVHAVTMNNETAPDANEVEATLRLQAHDSAGALEALRRQQWISPYDEKLHQQIADLSEQLGRYAAAVVERRAIIAMGPSDKLDAQYQLSRALLRAGDKDGARHEILQVLEQAPAFEKAQSLLLEIQGSHI
jgi:tetratricopeptide (TPR) repeat protein